MKSISAEPLLSSRTPMQEKQPLPKSCCSTAKLQRAGTVKGKNPVNMLSLIGWLWKKNGISVTTSVMQFLQDCLVNLLDTPGPGFSEDTYRTLTAVDSCLMVIDALSVEQRTIKLMEVTLARHTNFNLYEQNGPRSP